eukprot:7825235-Pyramimonas_sp.AAC.1
MQLEAARIHHLQVLAASSAMMMQANKSILVPSSSYPTGNPNLCPPALVTPALGGSMSPTSQIASLLAFGGKQFQPCSSAFTAAMVNLQQQQTSPTPTCHTTALSEYLLHMVNGQSV